MRIQKKYIGNYFQPAILKKAHLLLFYYHPLQFDVWSFMSIVAVNINSKCASVSSHSQNPAVKKGSSREGPCKKIVFGTCYYSINSRTKNICDISPLLYVFPGIQSENSTYQKVLTLAQQQWLGRNFSFLTIFSNKLSIIFS